MVHLGCLTESRISISRLIQNRSYSSNGDIFLTARKDGIILTNSFHLKFKSFNCLRISRPLTQLSKVFIRCSSQEYLFGKFSASYYQSICGGVFIFRTPLNGLKMKASSTIQVIKIKTMFLVTPSDVHFGFASPFFNVPDRACRNKFLQLCLTMIFTMTCKANSHQQQL